MLNALLALTLISGFHPRVAGGSLEHKAGWIIAHLQGTPAEVGFQHGALLATEIKDTIDTATISLKLDTGKDWQWYRTTARKLFWEKLDREYQEEIAAIARGAASEGMNVDTDDILALNSYIELSGYYLPVQQARERGGQVQSRAYMACSAFVATGDATKGGKVVMGHNLWWDYVMGERWRIVFDIKPSSGRAFMMDALPGFIESGSDWAINDAGIAFCETTISSFVGFDEKGIPEFMRMRKAIQYSKSLDDVCRIFKNGNNGGYASTWLMADVKTGEIGKLELGLKNVSYDHTANGYFVGANFPENPKLLAEETRGYDNNPVCEDRRARWIQHMEEHKGAVDTDMAKTFLADTFNKDSGARDGLGGGALCNNSPTFGAVNSKVLDSDMVRNMSFLARMGRSDGSLISVEEAIKADSKFKLFGNKFHDLPPQPWVVLQAKTRG